MVFALIFLACVAMAAALVQANPAEAAPLPNNRPFIYGMNPTPMAWWGLDSKEWDPKLFKSMQEAGCTVCRVGVNWDTVEREKGKYDWSETDKSVTLALDHNIEPLMLINSTPEWALQKGYDPKMVAAVARYPVDPEYAKDFDRFIQDVVRRYRGRVRYYEFWNEANGYGWYTALENPPTYGRADLYTPWMIRAYKNIKLTDPTALMSTTGIDDNGTGHAVSYLSSIYEHGGKGYFDAVADHPYSAGKFDAWKMDAIRGILDAHGDTHVTVWLTEYGYPMDAERYPEYQKHLKDFFDTLSQPKYDYVRISTWHTANEFPSEHGYGLTNKDLSPKPPYNTFKEYPKPARPVMSGVKVENISPSSVKISYKTDIDSRGLVMYGTDQYYGRITARDVKAGKEHNAILVGLTPNTEYHFRVRCGAVEDGDSFTRNYTFRTKDGKAVKVVSGPAVSNITDSSAVITWKTDVPAASVVGFSKGFAYDRTAKGVAKTKAHRVVLKGLDRKQNYQFRVISSAEGYADAAVEGRPFTTEAGNVVSMVSGPFVTDLTDSSAVIKWTTDKPSTSKVEYGTGSYAHSAGSSDLVTDHAVKLSGLDSVTRYKYRAVSSAKGYEDAVYENGSLTTVNKMGDFLNGGFENGLAGWKSWKSGDAEVKANVGNTGGVNPPDPATREFQNRLTLDLPERLAGAGGLYQTIDASNGVYLVSGWIAAGGDASVEMIGIDGDYKNDDPKGSVLGSLNQTSGWVYCTGLVEVTTGKLTVVLKLGQSGSAGAVSGYFDGLLVNPVKRGTIADIKNAALGQWVTVDVPKDVFAIDYERVFCVQDSDGKAGIKVRTIEPHGVAMGKKARFFGVRTRVGEDDIIDQAKVVE